MPKKSVKRTTKSTAHYDKSKTIVAFWIIALLIAFILLGAVAKPLLWIFVLGAFLSYYILNNR